jgi:hypothetical protein
MVLLATRRLVSAAVSFIYYALPPRERLLACVLLNVRGCILNVRGCILPLCRASERPSAASISWSLSFCFFAVAVSQHLVSVLASNFVQLIKS